MILSQVMVTQSCITKNIIEGPKTKTIISYNCHIPSLPVHKIHPYNDTAFSTSNLQAHPPQWSPSLQHTLAMVMQQSRYSVFHNRNTPI